MNAFFSSLEAKDWITFIGIFLTFIISLISIFISIHKSKQDGIVKYRMEWINNVRNEFSTIFGWEYFSYDESGNLKASSLQILRNSISKVALFLNVRDSYDSDILQLCFTYNKKAEEIYKRVVVGNAMPENFKLYLAMQNNNELNEVQKIKEDLLFKVRVYLKTEWTRVKVESSLCKFKYWYCWRPLRGFLPVKAIKKFNQEYIKM